LPHVPCHRAGQNPVLLLARQKRSTRAFRYRATYRWAKPMQHWPDS